MFWSATGTGAGGLGCEAVADPAGGEAAVDCAVEVPHPSHQSELEGIPAVLCWAIHFTHLYFTSVNRPRNQIPNPEIDLLLALSFKKRVRNEVTEPKKQVPWDLKKTGRITFAVS